MFEFNRELTADQLAQQGGHFTFSGECGALTDQDTDDYLTYGQQAHYIDSQVRETLRETQTLRSLGRLAPFVEGEPIGKYKKVKRTKPTADDIRRYHLKKREWQQAELLALRAKNDRDMESILGSR